MAINPDNITTIRVDQLATATLNIGNEFAHSQGSELKKATIQDLVDIVSTAVGAGSGVGFLPISVTDGQQLPSVPADPSFFLCGPGTYLNVNGYPDVVCTDELNAVMSLSDHWQLSVGIPITPDLPSIGISQSVNSGTIDKAPSENAVYNFVYNYVASQILKSSLGYFDYNDLATQTTPISVPSNTQTLLTNDTLGANTDETQPPFGVTSVWTAGTSNFFDFSELSIGDTVDVRVHLKTTTSANYQRYHIDLKAGIGSASEFENRIFSTYVNTPAVDEQSFVTTFYVGNADIRDYPAQLFITSVGNTATVEVVGWFVRVFRKSVNIVDIVVAEEAPIDGLIYGRKDAAWFEVTGGGSQTLAETLVLGNITDGENIEISDGDGVFMDNGSRLIKGVTDAGRGGAKGIALKCSIDYEYKWEAGTLYVLEQDGFTVRETKYNFAITPTATDDSTKGFIVGSRWILDNGDLYICKDATSTAAVWELQIVSGGGNGSLTYYLNGSVSQATIGGNAYNEMNSVPVIGAGTDFTISANGYIAQFLTDVGDPNRLIIPAGNWNFETYFSANSNGGSPRFYIELYKYDGATLTLLASNSATPEYITGGTAIDLYFSALAVPYTVLLATDRLAVRFYVIHSSKTITMHTENSHLCEVITTFSTGVDSVNGQTGVVVLDTADISEATDKNYVSDAELVVIGNTSGTNTGDQDLSTLQPYAVATFVAEITFDVPKIFFNFLAPTSATLTSNLTGAKKGVVQKIYVNHATNPVSALSGWVLIGSGTYTPSVANIIYAEWTDGSRVEYWIIKA